MTSVPLLGVALEGLLELLAPARCAACGVRLPGAAAFCATCALSLEPVPPGACPRCGGPTDRPGRCRRCRGAAPPFARARAPFLYGGQLAVALGRFKFGGHPELGRPLGALLAPALAAALTAAPPPALLVPVPLHPQRLRQREFNQALALLRAARAALAAAGAGPLPPLDPVALARIRPTPPQVGLGPAARAANVAGAFRADAARLRGRPVLLVDDVLTTGATAAAAAAALRAAGAPRVEVLTLARAVT